jgi:hypothetical protein
MTSSFQPGADPVNNRPDGDNSFLSVSLEQRSKQGWPRAQELVWRTFETDSDFTVTETREPKVAIEGMGSQWVHMCWIIEKVQWAVLHLTKVERWDKQTSLIWRRDAHKSTLLQEGSHLTQKKERVSEMLQDVSYCSAVEHISLELQPLCKRRRFGSRYARTSVAAIRNLHLSRASETTSDAFRYTFTPLHSDRPPKKWSTSQQSQNTPTSTNAERTRLRVRPNAHLCM